jgi:hypothetical protein
MARRCVFQAVAAEPILIGSVNDMTGFAATFGTQKVTASGWP